MTLIQPFIKRLSIAPMNRTRWLGMTETRQTGPETLKGGVEGLRPTRRHEIRNILQTIHGDGCVRLWDVGHGDDIENEKILQVDVARALGHFENVEVTQTSLAGASGELAVGLRSGELVVFRWGRNRNAGREPPPARGNAPQQLTNVTDRIESSLTEGLVPFTLLDQQDGPVTALKMSEVGFVAAGFEGGSLAVIDLRGPAIIFTGSVRDLSRSEKRGSLRGRGSSDATKPEWPTQIEFSVMKLEHKDWSSINLHVGTNQGNLATFEIVPDPSGRYAVQYSGSVHLESKVTHIFPINAETGRHALATQNGLASLRSGARTNGALFIVTPTAIHLFRPATAKGAHKSFDSYFCDAAALVRYQDLGHVLVALTGDGSARAYSIPALKEIACIPISNMLDVRRFSEACITPSGQIIGFTGPSEIAMLSVFGSGEPLPHSQARLFNPQVVIPPRPTISNVQWITGTQYITPSDLDLLIGGPDRPPSKRMVLQAKADQAQRMSAAAKAGGAGPSAAAGQEEGYWGYMQRQIQERTEKLGIVGDSMDNLEQNSSNWLEDVNKFVGKQKRNAAGSILKAKFGL